MIPATAEDISEEYRILLNELKEYNPALLDKERMIAISKMDLVTEEEDMERIKAQIPDNLPYMMISSAMQQGLTELKDVIWESLQKAQESFVQPEEESEEEYNQDDIHDFSE